MADASAQMATAPAPAAKDQHAIVKTASAKTAEHIGRKVKTLDQVTNGINKRHQAALDNLVRMRHELDIKQKNIEFSQKARDTLAAKIEANKAKAGELRKMLLVQEKAFGTMLADMQDNVRCLTNGRGDTRGFKQVTKQLQRQDLAVTRGYHCGVGSTMGRTGLSTS